MVQYKPGGRSVTRNTFLLSDMQINQVVRGYFENPNFAIESDGSLSLWKLYNLLTGANKSSYLDTFLNKSVNAVTFTSQFASALKGEESSWFMQ